MKDRRIIIILVLIVAAGLAHWAYVSFSTAQRGEDGAEDAPAAAVTDTVDYAWYRSAITLNPNETNFTVYTAADLAGLAKIVNGTWGDFPPQDDFKGKTVRLAFDIDLSPYKNWVPIGNCEDVSADTSEVFTDAPFSGTFDGGSHVISNLTINRPSVHCQGLFGQVNYGGRVENLTLEGVDVLGSVTVGSVAALLKKNSHISFCSASGTVRASGGTGSRTVTNLGGLAGYVTDESGVSGSSFYGTVSGGRMSTGGVAGSVVRRSRVAGSCAVATVSGGNEVGGLVGRLSGGSSVERSYSAGAVSGWDYIGGMAGEMAGGSGIRSSYSAAAVRGNSRVGGVVGYIHECEHISCPGIVIGCAALNPELISGVSGWNAGRVTGNRDHHLDNRSEDTLSNNAAYAGMANVYGNTAWETAFANRANGESITAAAILADPTIGGRFTKGNGWTLESGKLPGLGDMAVDAPHFQIHLILPLDSVRAGRGGTRQFTVSAFGESADKSVIWSVSGNASKATFINASGLLAVAEGEIAPELTVTARAAVNPAVSASATVTVTHLTDTRWYAANPTAAAFTISTDAELAGLAEIVNGTWGGTPQRDSFAGKTVKLAASIDLSRYVNWMPIGTYDTRNWSGNPFSGTFDGGSHAISNLRVGYPDKNGAGLFAYVKGGTIKNVGVADADVNGRGIVGALVGYLEAQGRIVSCYSTGAVSGGDDVGGLAGWISRSSVSKSYSMCAVSGAKNVGGAVGVIRYRSSVSNCYAAGPVSGKSNVGGVAGDLNDDGDLSGLTGSAALNPEVKGGESVWRITGNMVYYDGRITGKLANNAALEGMKNSFGGTRWDNPGADKRDGIGITAEKIKTDGTIGGRFTGKGGWTIENGKLPGLGGRAVEMPGHLR